MTLTRRSLLTGTLGTGALAALATTGMTPEHAQALGGASWRGYGAPADGKGDASDAIEECFAENMVVAGDSGRYRITRPLVVPPGRMVVQMPDSHLLWDFEGAHMLTFAGKNIQWGGGTWNGQGHRLSAAARITITAFRIRIIGVNITGWGSLAHDEDWGKLGDGLYLDRATTTESSRYITAWRNKITRCTRSGISWLGGRNVDLRHNDISRIGGRFPGGAANQPGANILIEPSEPLATEPKRLLDGVVRDNLLGEVDRHCYRQNVAGADFTGPIAMQLGPRDFVMPGANVTAA